MQMPQPAFIIMDRGCEHIWHRGLLPVTEAVGALGLRDAGT